MAKGLLGDLLDYSEDDGPVRYVCEAGACDACEENNGETFESADDAPALPIHPNCKCYLEKVGSL